MSLGGCERCDWGKLRRRKRPLLEVASGEIAASEVMENPLSGSMRSWLHAAKACQIQRSTYTVQALALTRKSVFRQFLSFVGLRRQLVLMLMLMGPKPAPIFVALSFVNYHQATPACLLGLLDACISPLSFLLFLPSRPSRPHARELNPSSLAHCPSFVPYHRATLFAGTRYTTPISNIPTYS